MAFDGRLLSGLGVLAAVVESGTFVRAGEALGLTPSGVSRAVARLEERIGVRLFQRSARAVTLTEEGRRFYAQVTPLLGGIEDAASEAAGASASPRGHLRVTVDALVGRVVIGAHVASFLQANPGLTLELVVRDRLGDLIADGFDASVRFGEPEPSSLVARKLLDTRVLTYAAASYLARAGTPRHPRDLVNHECVHFLDPQTGRPFEWIFCRNGETVSVPVSGRLTVNDGVTRLAACQAGLGIVQMLEIEMASTPRRPQLVRILPGWSEERFPLHVYHPSRHLPPAKVRAFVDFVVALARGSIHPGTTARPPEPEPKARTSARPGGSESRQKPAQPVSGRRSSASSVARSSATTRR